MFNSKIKLKYVYIGFLAFLLTTMFVSTLGEKIMNDYLFSVIMIYCFATILTCIAEIQHRDSKIDNKIKEPEPSLSAKINNTLNQIYITVRGIPSMDRNLLSDAGIVYSTVNSFTDNPVERIMLHPKLVIVISNQVKGLTCTIELYGTLIADSREMEKYPQLLSILENKLDQVNRIKEIIIQREEEKQRIRHENITEALNELSDQLLGPEIQ